MLEKLKPVWARRRPTIVLIALATDFLFSGFMFWLTPSSQRGLMDALFLVALSLPLGLLLGFRVAMDRDSETRLEHRPQSAAQLDPPPRLSSNDRIRYFLVLIDRHPPGGLEQWYVQMATSLRSRGRPYGECIDPDTKMKIVVVDSLPRVDEYFIAAVAMKHFQGIWGREPNLQLIQYQQFQGEGGCGVIIEEWDQPSNTGLPSSASSKPT